MRLLNTQLPDFHKQLDQLLAWESVADPQVAATVEAIIADIRQQGDPPLLAYTNRFDRRSVASVSALKVAVEDCQKALAGLPQDQRWALQQAAERVRAYHQHQVQESWQFTDADGTVLGQKITPMDRVGIYVPGGKASYPSSVLMNAIPAKVAGVEQVVMVVPAPDGELNPMVLAAASLAGVDEIYTIGGAQAVAALAYGTHSINKVDKIVGPGNIYVATAKRAVFGQVAIDMIAGPSEILVVCEGDTDPNWVAMDLFSQAEHDEQAQAILISTQAAFLKQVSASIDKLLPDRARAQIIRQSLTHRGALIHAQDRTQVLELINRIAPEHLELSVADPEYYIDNIRHAGAIFMGPYTSEALGDYCAGPNHVLPTSGTARFSSPLGVYDFIKRSSIIHCSAKGADALGQIASVLARGESLEAHARSAEYRIKAKNPS
ncbi:MAG: histidinol dehydrogenase [Pseudomonadota bacterium]